VAEITIGISKHSPKESLENGSKVLFTIKTTFTDNKLFFSREIRLALLYIAMVTFILQSSVSHCLPAYSQDPDLEGTIKV
jgi:hypothetical protein